MTHPRPTAASRPPLILASRSPRRRDLLAEAGYPFQIIAPDDDVECGVCSEGGPAGLVAELALRKAAAVVSMIQKNPELVRSPGAATQIVLGADTVAECGGLILGKPRDEDDARSMLTRLSGREHRVFTGVCLWPLCLAPNSAGDVSDATLRTRVAVTRLRTDPLPAAEIDDYVSSGQWEGKAGGFGYQDRLGWIHIVEGSESNVVGLPLELLAEMLNEITQSN